MQTVSQLQIAGFTHLQRTCDTPDCPSVMAEISFDQIRAMRPRWLVSAMTVDDLQAKMPCKRCGSRKLSLSPVDRRSEAERLGKHSYPDYGR
jgi:hypothetical protein